MTANELVYATAVPAWADGTEAIEGTPNETAGDDVWDLYRDGQRVGCMYDEGNGYEFAQGQASDTLLGALRPEDERK